MYEDFYDEYSEFDRQIEEFKQGILQGVKSEILQELADLKKENRELQSIKNKMEKYEFEQRNKITELEQERKNVGRKTFIKLLEENVRAYYFPQNAYLKRKKCDKCDHNRYVNYTTPLGRTASELCDVCGDTVIVQKPYQAMCCEINDRNKKTTYFYNFTGDKDTREVHKIKKVITNASEFDTYENDYWERTVFDTMELCQEFCDLQNKDVDFSNLETEQER